MGRPKKEDKQEELSKSDLFAQKCKEREKEFSLKVASEIEVMPRIKTHVYAMDYVLGGGIIQGGTHIIEFYGLESTGKSMMALKVAKAYQELGKNVAYVTAEVGFDKEWASQLGVNIDKLLLVEEKILEKVGDFLIEFMPVTDLIIIDSIPALIPMEESNGTSLEDKYMASTAKVMPPFIRKINEVSPKSQCTVIMINQLREKLGVKFGNPLQTPCGRALKFLFQTRIEFKRKEAITIGANEEKEQIGVVYQVKGEKNKAGIEKRQANFDFYYNGTIDQSKSLMFAGLKYGIITLEGQTYSYKDLSVRGEKNFKEALTSEHLKTLEDEIWKVSK